MPKTLPYWMREGFDSWRDSPPPRAKTVDRTVIEKPRITTTTVSAADLAGKTITTSRTYTEADWDKLRETYIEGLKDDPADDYSHVWEDFERLKKEEAHMGKATTPKKPADPHMDAVRRTNRYIERNYPSLIDSRSEFGPVERLARGLARITELRLHEAEALEMAQCWNNDLHEELKLFMSGGELSEKVPPHELGGFKPWLKTRKVVLKKAVGAVVLDELTDIERTLKPKSEHSAEADLERTLELVALEEDPDYGSW